MAKPLHSEWLRPLARFPIGFGGFLLFFFEFDPNFNKAQMDLEYFFRIFFSEGGPPFLNFNRAQMDLEFFLTKNSNFSFFDIF